MSRRIGLLVALLAALIVVFLASMLAGSYFYWLPTQTKFPMELHRKVQREGSISTSILPGSPTLSSMNLHGIAYQSEPAGRPLREEDLGSKFAEPVRETVEGDHVTTKQVPVYAVKGYDTAFRLAASVDDSLILFEAVSNPKGKEASDLLDIGGKVSSIGVYDREAADLTLAKATARDLLLGTIGDPEKAEEVVQGLMDAPLKPTPSGYYESGALTYVIVFHLKDGTAVLRDYRTDTGRLDNNISGWGGGGYPQPLRSIVTPQAFREAVEEEGYTEAPPDSTLSYGGREVKSSESLVHSWEYSGDVFRAMIDDLLTTPPRKEMLTVPSGSKMLFRYETQGPPNKVSATGYPLIADKNRPPGDPQGWGPGRSLKAYGSGVERTIPVELQPRRPGYAIVVTVKEPQGKVSYAFRVMVE